MKFLPPSLVRARRSRWFYQSLALLVLAGLPSSAQALDIQDTFIGTSTTSPVSLQTAASWSLGVIPGTGNDAVFGPSFPTAAVTLSITATSPTYGTLNDTNLNSLVIGNATTEATNSVLTLSGGSGNSFSGVTTDLLYVGAGSTLTVQGKNASGTTGTGTLSLILGQSGTFDVAGTATISAVMSGANTGVGITKTGVGTLTLSAANAYTGTTAVNRGTLLLDFSGAGTPAVTPTSNIISSSSALALGGGTLTVNGPTEGTVTNSQTFNGTTLNQGYSQVTAISGSAATANTTDTVNLALGSLTHNTAR